MMATPLVFVLALLHFSVLKASASTGGDPCQRILVDASAPNKEELKRWDSIKKITDNPLAFEEMIQQRARAAFAAGEKTFSYREMTPYLQTVLADISGRIPFYEGTVWGRKLAALHAEGLDLLKRDLPYFELIAFSFKWSEEVDRLIRRASLTKIQKFLRATSDGELKDFQRQANQLLTTNPDTDHHGFAVDSYNFSLSLARQMLVSYRTKSSTPEQRAWIETLITHGANIALNNDDALKPHEFIVQCNALAKSLGVEFPFQPQDLLSVFHQTYGKNRLKELLDGVPDNILILTAEPVTIRMFNRVRASGLVIVGFISTPQYIDNFTLSTVEFPYHDVGHSWLMASQDSRFPMQTRRARYAEYLELERVIDLLALTDPSLARIAEYYLFEVSHERGYPFEVLALLNEVNTEMWVETILKKLSTRFWAINPLNDQEVTRLNEGRLWILHQMKVLIENRLLRNNQLQLQSAQSQIIKVSALQRSYHGSLRRFEVSNEGKLTVELHTFEDGLVRKTDIFNLSVSQVPVAQRPWLQQPQLLGRINPIAHALITQSQVFHAGNTARVQNLFFEQEGLFKVRLKYDGEVTIPGTQDLSLDEIEVRSETGLPGPLTTYDFFKARQAIYLAENNLQIQFSAIDMPRVYEGHILAITGNQLGYRQVILEVQTASGGKERVAAPLSEVSFPLPHAVVAP